MPKFVYVMSKPGSDLDGEDTTIAADCRVDADVAAERRRKAWGCTEMRFIGYREGSGDSARFKPGVPVDELPEWAKLQPCTSCKDGSCMLCDDFGLVPVQVAS